MWTAPENKTRTAGIASNAWSRADVLDGDVDKAAARRVGRRYGIRVLLTGDIVAIGA
jgi:hypothetical protein